MKLAVIGGGSTYAPLVMDEVVRAMPSQRVEISLFDILHTRAHDNASALSRRLTVSDTEVNAETDLRSALVGADIVVLMFRSGPVDIRMRLERLAVRNRLLAQETQGVCGLFSALLNIESLKQIAPAITSTCPDARVIVLTNPTGIVTAAAQDLGLRAIGMCELPFGMLGRARSALESLTDASLDNLAYVGTNHFGWMGVERTHSSNIQQWNEVKDAIRLYLPRSIPEVVANAADLIDSDGVPNPYIGFLCSDASISGRSEEVRALESRSRRALADQDWASYHEVMARRGGYLIAPMLAHFLGSLDAEGAVSAVVCSREEKLASEFGSNAAFEFSSRVDRNFQVVRHLTNPGLSLEARNLIRCMANYESLVVRGALQNDVEACMEAVVVNPFIAPGSAAFTAFQDFASDLAAHLFEHGSAHDG